jgi:hypothetical protein
MTQKVQRTFEPSSIKQSQIRSTVFIGATVENSVRNLNRELRLKKVACEYQVSNQPVDTNQRKFNLVLQKQRVYGWYVRLEQVPAPSA